MGVPRNDWFIMENPNLKWKIWVYSYIRKPPYNFWSTKSLLLKMAIEIGDLPIKNCAFP